MKSSILLLKIVLLVLVASACKDNPANGEMEPLFETNLGNEISMDGIWNAGCGEDLGRFLTESFRFSGSSLTISINEYSDSQCSNLAQNMIVEIEFSVDGTISGTLNDATVTANRISGTQQIGGETETFKQTIYVVESETGTLFYHGRFGEDGGATVNGYPTELIPFSFQKVSE